MTSGDTAHTPAISAKVGKHIHREHLLYELVPQLSCQYRKAEANRQPHGQ